MAANKKAKKLTSFRNFLATLFLIGAIGVLFYPIVANYLASRQMSQSVQNYNNAVSKLSQTQIDEMLNAARNYNKWVYDLQFGIKWQGAAPDYNKQLNVQSNGMMGYLDIPQLSIKNLPIYHGDSEDILSGGIGDVPDTTLPIGGANTHAVLPAHSGRVNDSLFTDLDKLKLGDVFYIHVLNLDLEYQIDDIRIVYPNQINSLKIQQGRDLVTLVTCYPTGINNKRLLVTGHRMPLNAKIPQSKISRNAYGYNFWVMFGAAVLALLGLFWLLYELLDWLLWLIGTWGWLTIPKAHVRLAPVSHGGKIKPQHRKLIQLKAVELAAHPLGKGNSLPDQSGHSTSLHAFDIDHCFLGDEFVIRRLLHKRKVYKIEFVQDLIGENQPLYLLKGKGLVNIQTKFTADDGKVHKVLIRGKLKQKNKK